MSAIAQGNQGAATVMKRISRSMRGFLEGDAAMRRRPGFLLNLVFWTLTAGFWTGVQAGSSAGSLPLELPVDRIEITVAGTQLLVGAQEQLSQQRGP